MGLIMKDAKAKLADIQAQIERLKAQEELLLELLGENKNVKRPRANVKQTVLDLLERVGTAGLNASVAVEMAKQDGTRLERGSVSSILSRLKSDGVVHYDNTVYRLPKFVPENKKTVPGAPGAVIKALRSSGVQQ